MVDDLSATEISTWTGRQPAMGIRPRWRVQIRADAGIGALLRGQAADQALFIDSLMKCGVKQDDYDAQSAFVSALCDICRDTGSTSTWLHTQKQLDESRQPGKMDVKAAEPLATWFSTSSPSGATNRKNQRNRPAITPTMTNQTRC